MTNKFIAALFLSLLFSYSLTAQSGKVTGTIYDGAYNDVLSFANIIIKDTQKGTTSDFEGDYALELEEGTYTLLFSFVGYETKEVNDVTVKRNDVLDLDITLNPTAAMLEEVVVTTTARRNTEETVLSLQKNSITLMDGLSLQSIKRAGAGNLASAIKSVPGVSIQDGKYVYVRGLGDRYTKSIVNGMDIPGLDPDMNTIQMDIFPTNILENILVIKSASAELPADFTGGVIDIVTKDFPSKKQLGFSFSGGFNPDMHFQDNYLSYEGGATDLLGFDDGTRELPISPGTNIPDPASANNAPLETITRAFNPNMAAKREKSFMDVGFGFNYGNQFELGTNKLGVIASLDYKNTTDFYEGFENGIYQKPREADEYELLFDRRQQGDLGVNNVLGSVLAGLSYKREKAKYGLNILHIQNGESRAALFDQETQLSNAIEVVKDNLEYTERSITNVLLSGKHSGGDGSFTTEWKVSPTLSKVQDKDVRLTTFIKQNDGSFTISSDAGFPNRIWRDLEEVNAVGKVDFTKKYTLGDKAAVAKFGGLYSYKQRDYSIHNYDIGFRAVDPVELNGDPNAILADQNIWDPQSNSGYYIRGNFQPANTFDATQYTAAIYVSNEFTLGERLRTVLGLRAEYFVSYFTGQNNTGSQIFDNEKTIDAPDFFPSANLIYTLKENSNLRLSYYRTTARPSFKEVSVVQISDLLTGIIFLGNIDLQPSYINNLDLRYEVFKEDAQMYAVSAFYKRFKDPIEVVAFSATAPNQFTPKNAPEAEVYGLELELRNNFGFIAENLRNLSVNLNVSYIESRIEMNKGPNEEYQSRLAFTRDGEEIDETRQLQGQSPYLINAGLTYNNPKIGLETGLFYNVQGKTLEVVGFGKNPDVFIQPFNSLNFNFSKKIGKEKNASIGFKVENILKDTRESLYDSFGAEERIFEQRRPGRTFSLGYSLSF